MTFQTYSEIISYLKTQIMVFTQERKLSDDYEYKQYCFGRIEAMKSLLDYLKSLKIG